MAADCEEDLEIPLEESPLSVGGVDPGISFKEAYRNRGESQCRAVWRAGSLYRRCFTCGLQPSSAICTLCFKGGKHQGHEVVLQVSKGSGFCDCGNPSFWRESGFCASNHFHLRLHSSVHEFEEEHLGSTLDGDVGCGASSSRPSSSASTTSCYYSPRIQSMIENRSKFASDFEFETEYAKVHHTETEPTENIEDSGEMDPTGNTQDFGDVNQKYFLVLQEKYWNDLFFKERNGMNGNNHFFKERDDIVIGKKIGEGGQAEIYEVGEDYVVKVFPQNLLLENLEKQWPEGIISGLDEDLHRPRRLSSIQGGLLLKDSRFFNRFAFLMDRHWGDLRKLIDLRKVEGNNQGPPFSLWQVRRLMFCIARDVHSLHSCHPSILHRDLKASNVLVHGLQRPSLNEKILASVADFECSVGIVGTGFWRAPEILEQLKNGVGSSALKFTKACDVYSFGMVCYELITGCLPFEGHPIRDYDFILDGNRLELPEDLHPMMKSIVVHCWHADPSRRPSFLDIIAKLNKFK